MSNEIIVSENKDWIAEVTEVDGKRCTTVIQPVGGNSSIYFWRDFRAFKEFINSLPDGDVGGKSE